ncbi:MAG: hypothetical protein JW837_17700 [Sedimentisphaerales bacterium]|nr:hypothetical protein [Sedimentisphaerales bacterium]
MLIMIPGIFKIFMILIIFILIFGVISLIVFLFKLCSKRSWISFIAAILLLLLFTAFFLHIPKMHLIRHFAGRHPISYKEPIPSWSENTNAAIWLPGIEDQFEANVYPSKISAVRSLGLKIRKPILQVFGNEKPPARIILFRGAHDHELVDEFGNALADVYPETKWADEPETVGVQADEIGIRLDLMNVQTHPAPWADKSKGKVASGTIQACVLTSDKQVSIKTNFVEKPWVEDFSGFSNTKSDGRFIIARSMDSCMTEAEANRQAVEEACKHMNKMLAGLSRGLPKIPATYTHSVNTDDIFEGDFILDRFAQSFEGTAGKIWRQALLIDASTEKLAKLARHKAAMIRENKRTWARISVSVFGLIILITTVYAFLNAATKGYYVWSLRIAGMVLFLVVIIFFLL